MDFDPHCKVRVGLSFEIAFAEIFLIRFSPKAKNYQNFSSKRKNFTSALPKLH